MFSSKSRTLFLLYLTLQLIRADLPVHCVKHQIAGPWKIEQEKPTLSGLGPLPCGHSVPDDKLTSQRAY